MKINLLYSAIDNEILKKRWLEIQNIRKYQNNPFIVFHRFCAWEEENKLARRYQLIIVTVEDEGQIVIIAPFAIRKKNGIRIIYLAGAQYADYNDILIDDGFEHLVDKMLKKFINPCDVMIFRGIREDSPLYYLSTKQELTLYHKVLPQTVSPYIDIRNNGTELNENVKKSVIKDISYNIKRLEKNGNLELYIPKNKLESLNMVENLFEMHINEWNNKGLASIFENELCKKYYRRLVTIGDIYETNTFIASIKYNNRSIAILFGQKRANAIYYYKPAYDIEMKKYSPGKIMIYYLIKHLEEIGESRLDLLVGNEKYKYDWTSSEDNIHSIFITSNNFIGRFLSSLIMKREYRKNKN